MTSGKRILLFFVLPIIGLLSYPPSSLVAGLPVLAFVIATLCLLGFWLWRGYALALTFSIFLQGLNVIIRLMMFFPNTFKTGGVIDPTYMVVNLFGSILSFYLMLRLDRGDIRTTMIR